MVGMKNYLSCRFTDISPRTPVKVKRFLTTTYPVFISSKRGHLATQRMPPLLLFKSYCSKLSIKLKIQDGARRALGGLKGCRCVFLVIYNYIKEILYMWIKVMA